MTNENFQSDHQNVDDFVLNLCDNFDTQSNGIISHSLNQEEMEEFNQVLTINSELTNGDTHLPSVEEHKTTNVQPSCDLNNEQTRGDSYLLLDSTTTHSQDEQVHVHSNFALHNAIMDVVITSQSDQSVFDFLERINEKVLDEITKLSASEKDYHIECVLNTHFVKYSGNKVSEQIDKDLSITTGLSEFDVKEMNRELQEQLENCLLLGSGWTVEHANSLTLKMTEKYSISHVYGSGKLIEIDPILKGKHAIINVEQGFETNDCLKFAILSAIHFKDIDRKQSSRRSQYIRFMDEYNWNGIEYPSTINDIVHFQRNNPGVYINLFMWEKKKIKKVRSAVIPYDKEDITGIFINLLSVKDLASGNWHYVCITSLNRLLNKQGSHKYNYCSRCLQPFQTMDKKRFSEHQSVCYGKLVKSIKLPKAGSVQKFTAFSKTEKLPYVVFADIECYLKKNKDGVKHVPCAFGIFFCCSVDSKRKPLENSYRVFTGEQCINKGLKHLTHLGCQVYEWNRKNTYVAYSLTPEEEKSFQTSTTCPQCLNNYDLKRLKVRDHCHVTGNYRGDMCSKCNSARRFTRKSLPIYFHNFQRYDSHLITKMFGEIKEENGSIWDGIHVLAKSTEQYLSIIVDLKVGTYIPKSQNETPVKPKAKNILFKLHFKDSILFLTDSLDRLVQSLDKSQLVHTSHMLETVYNSSEIDLICKKGIFPYDWFNSYERMNETKLPSIKKFYDYLNSRECTAEDYERAQQMWRVFKCERFEDYVLSYLRLDVMQLTDVIEASRNLSLKEDGLDHAHYMSMPQFTKDSALKMCKVELDLFSKYEMYDFATRGIRGGMCFVNKHYAESSENEELLNIDANNLYGKALSMKLPHRNYEWIDDSDKLEKLTADFMQIDMDDESNGMILEVDIDYPIEVQNKSEDLPFAPEHCIPHWNCLTNYMQRLSQDMKLDSRNGFKKLMLTHMDKKNYIVHGKILQFYIRQGMILQKIHKVLTFHQSEIFKPYIDLNSQKRQQATSKFAKNYYKLKNNSLFGKTMEDKTRRINFRLVTNREDLLKLTWRPDFLKRKVFSGNLIGVLMEGKNCLLDVPIAIGQSILDLSKLVMYQWKYETFVALEQELNCKLEILYGDTDSFFVSVRNTSVYNQLLPKMLEYNYLDSSNYPQSHPLYTKRNTASLTCIKDESESRPFSRFVMLRPKCYALEYECEGDKKCSKGVQRSVVAQKLTVGDYYAIYKEARNTLSTDQKRFKSENHVIHTISYSKVSLSCWEDKRAWISQNESLPYGNHRLSSKPPFNAFRRKNLFVQEENDETQIDSKNDKEDDLVDRIIHSCDEDEHSSQDDEFELDFIDDSNAPRFVPGKQFRKRASSNQFFEMECKKQKLNQS